MDIEAVLFPRVELGKVGLAPVTSMFMFSPNGRISTDDFRPEVHDSDGLLMFNGRGEHIWRPLQNPAQVEVSAFLDARPVGFGLMQRDRNPADYQDFEAVYDRRPSLWIEPAGDWGEGAVVLTEIPSDAEIHDNIVAFWRPKAPLPPGAEYRYAYRASWGDGPPAELERARVVATRRGRADVRGPTPVRRFVVDYLPAAKMAHAPRKPLPQAKVTTSAGAIKNVVVADNPLIGGYRLSFVFDPRPAKVAELRAELSFERRAERRDLGLPMDSSVSPGEPNQETALSTGTFLPQELPGTMPRQDLSVAVGKETRHVPIHPERRLAPALRRTFVFGGAALLSGIAINEMRLVLNVGGLTILEIVVLVLFALNTIWISLSVPMAIAGFVRLLFRRSRTADAGPLTSRTALLMPLYNEEPARAAAALDAMASDLVERGRSRSLRPVHSQRHDRR